MRYLFKATNRGQLTVSLSILPSVNNVITKSNLAVEALARLLTHGKPLDEAVSNFELSLSEKFRLCKSL